MILITHCYTRPHDLVEKMGEPDYSYRFVLDRFRPVLDRIAPTTEVVQPKVEIDAINEFAGAIEHEAVYLSFNPVQQTLVELSTPTIPVFAWEFDDLPDGAWNPDEPREDWAFVLRKTGRCVTHSTHAAEVVRKALGDSFPIAVMPAPLPPHLEDLSPEARVSTLDIEVTGRVTDSERVLNSAGTRMESSARGSLDLSLGGTIITRAQELPPGVTRVQVDPDAIVYTAVFNPRDGRKNWRDMVNGFCVALREENATLILKVFGQATQKFHAELNAMLKRLQPIKCRVLAIDAMLDEDTYVSLIQGTHYSLNASHGEGQCLPLMEFMALGKPAVAPNHTGMLDYLDDGCGFPYRSSMEPASWPQDTSHRVSTSRQRVDIEALMGAVAASYELARTDWSGYELVSKSAAESVRSWAGSDVVEAKLREMLGAELQATA